MDSTIEQRPLGAHVVWERPAEQTRCLVINELCASCGDAVSFASRYRRNLDRRRVFFCSTACRENSFAKPPSNDRFTRLTLGKLKFSLVGALVWLLVGAIYLYAVSIERSPAERGVRTSENERTDRVMVY